MPKINLLHNNLYPFFCYYGGKWRAAKRYPKPKHAHIIEPFAGAAGYSLRYPYLNVTLYDTDPAVYGVWSYLLKASKQDILALPLNVQHVDDLSVCQEAKWLIGFWLNKGSTAPSLTPSSWMRSGMRPNSQWGKVIRERIAHQIGSIKHWKVLNKSYEEANNTEATWFIDPPYQGACGKLYRCRFSEYDNLSRWCRSRKGQVIVCENVEATWLPFQPFSTIKTTPGSRGKSRSEEAIWTK